MRIIPDNADIINAARARYDWVKEPNLAGWTGLPTSLCHNGSSKDKLRISERGGVKCLTHDVSDGRQATADDIRKKLGLEPRGVIRIAKDEKAMTDDERKALWGKRVVNLTDNADQWADQLMPECPICGNGAFSVVYKGIQGYPYFTRAGCVMEGGCQASRKDLRQILATRSYTGYKDSPPGRIEFFERYEMADGRAVHCKRREPGKQFIAFTEGERNPGLSSILLRGSKPAEWHSLQCQDNATCTLVFTEGAGAASAIRDTKYCALTVAGGGKLTSDFDFREYVGRNFIIWADMDEGGASGALDIHARILAQTGMNAKWINPSTLDVDFTQGDAEDLPIHLIEWLVGNATDTAPDYVREVAIREKKGNSALSVLERYGLKRILVIHADSKDAALVSKRVYRLEPMNGTALEVGQIGQITAQKAFLDNILEATGEWQERVPNAVWSKYLSEISKSFTHIYPGDPEHPRSKDETRETLSWVNAYRYAFQLGSTPVTNDKDAKDKLISGRSFEYEGLVYLMPTHFRNAMLKMNMATSSDMTQRFIKSRLLDAGFERTIQHTGGKPKTRLVYTVKTETLDEAEGGYTEDAHSILTSLYETETTAAESC